MKNSHFKKALSMFLSILMVFSCFAGMPVLIGHDHTHAEAATTDLKDKYLFAYFTGTSKEGQTIHLAVSEDGYNYTALRNNEPVIIPSKGVGNVRDPYIWYNENDNYYYILATDLDFTDGGGTYSNNSQSFIIWRSKDLVNWYDETFIDVAAMSHLIGDTRNMSAVWAPQVLWDGSAYVVYFTLACNATSWFDIVYLKTTDLLDPNAYYEFDYILGNGTGNGTDNGYGVIDADIIHNPGDGKYYLFYKTECNGHEMGSTATGTSLKTIHYYVGDTPTGPFRNPGDTKWANAGFSVFPNYNVSLEGCNSFWDNDGNLIMYVDEFEHTNAAGEAEAYFHIAKSNGNDFTSWTYPDVSQHNINSLSPRHGSVVKITTEEYNRLLENSYNISSSSYPETETLEDHLVAQYFTTDDPSWNNVIGQPNLKNVTGITMVDDPSIGYYASFDSTNGGWAEVDFDSLFLKTNGLNYTDGFTITFNAMLQPNSAVNNENNDRIYEIADVFGSRTGTEHYTHFSPGGGGTGSYLGNYNGPVDSGNDWLNDKDGANRDDECFHEYIISYATGNVMVYVDGELVISRNRFTGVKLDDSWYKALGSNATMRIGKSGWDADPLFKGRIQNLCIYDCSMSYYDAKTLNDDYKENIGWVEKENYTGITTVVPTFQNTDAARMQSLPNASSHFSNILYTSNTVKNYDGNNMSTDSAVYHYNGNDFYFALYYPETTVLLLDGINPAIMPVSFGAYCQNSRASKGFLNIYPTTGAGSTTDLGELEISQNWGGWYNNGDYYECIVSHADGYIGRNSTTSSWSHITDKKNYDCHWGAPLKVNESKIDFGNSYYKKYNLTWQVNGGVDGTYAADHSATLTSNNDIYVIDFRPILNLRNSITEEMYNEVMNNAALCPALREKYASAVYTIRTLDPNNFGFAASPITATKACAKAIGEAVSTYQGVLDEIARQESVGTYGHNIAEFEAREATCSVNGLTGGQYCTICGEILVEQEVLATLPHIFGNEFTENGIQYKQCSVCGVKLEYKQYELRYENLFSFNMWDESASKGVFSGTISTNTANGTITIVNQNTSEIYTRGTYDGQNLVATRDFGNYCIPVVGGRTYVVEATNLASSTSHGEVFIFQYNKDGLAFSAIPTVLGLNPGQTAHNEFTVDSNAMFIELRFDCNDAGKTITYADIGVYEKANYDRFGADTANSRLAFYPGDDKDLTHPNPADGYSFAGWYTGNGVKIENVNQLNNPTTLVYGKWIPAGYNVVYDSIFSFSDWAKSSCNQLWYGDSKDANGNVTRLVSIEGILADSANGTITITNDEDTNNFARTNYWADNGNVYKSALKQNTEYILQYTATSDDGGKPSVCLYITGGTNQYPETGNATRYSTGTHFFRFDSGDNTKLTLRFDNVQHGSTVTFSDIAVYEASFEEAARTITNREYMRYYPTKMGIGNVFEYTPVRPGFQFVTWMADTDGDMVGDYDMGNLNDDFLVEQNWHLFSTWTENTYTIKYNANGGTGSVAEQTVNYTADVTLDNGAGLSRTGYKFLGWSTVDNATTATYQPGQTTNRMVGENGGSITLYAVWQLVNVKVLFDNLFDYSSFTIGTGSLTINERTETGFTVTSTGGDANTGFSAAIPVESGKTYRLEADAQIEAVSGGYDVYVHTLDANQAGETTATPDTTNGAHREGNVYISLTGQTTNTKPYIQFTAGDNTAFVKIRFDANAVGNKLTVNNIRLYEVGKVADGVSYETAKEIAYGSAIDVVPTREGYTFDGWVDAEGNKVTTVNFTETKTLYSAWTANKYTVKFVDVNGNTVSEKEYDYGTSAGSVAKPANTTKDPDATYHYNYAWQTVADVTANATYTETETKTAHTFGDWTETKKPTCTAVGAKQRTCSACGYIETATVDATGHTPGAAATCTTAQICTACDVELNAALGHLDENSDHVCDRGCGIAQGTCSDSATDKDHFCDYGCGKVLEACSDASGDGNHNCDICGADNVTDHVKGEEKRENITDATCDAAGEYDSVYYCTECNTEMERTNDVTIDKLPHSWKDATYTWSADGKTCTVTRVCANFASHTESETVNATGEQNAAPTCEEKGSTIYTATFTVDWASTQTTEIYDIPENGHTAGDVVVENKKAPTCTADGSYDNVTYCTVCNKEIARNTVADPATGHNPAAAVEENRTESTCTVAGSYDSVVYCSVCNAQISRTKVDLPLAAHTEEIIPAVAPTCTEKGKTEGKKCSVCGEILVAQTDVAPLGHDWAETTYSFADDGSSCSATRKCKRDAAHVETANAEITPAVKNPATCTEKGTTTYTATFSVDWAEEQSKDVVDIKELGHDWAETTYSFADDGSSCSATRVCNRDASHVETAKAEITSAITTPATCTEKGTTTYTATFTEDWAAKQSKDVDNIAALEHAWSATYTSNGDGKDNTHYQTCTRENCGAKNTAVPHTWDNGKITTSATCTTDGVTTYTCTASGCGATYTEAISQTGHTPAAAVEENRNEATCTVAGSYESVVYCSVCKAEISRTTETIAAAGHRFGAETPAKAATCVATGNEAYKSCTVCNKFFAAEAAIDSTAANDSVDAFTTQIDPDNHDLKTTAAKAPTCTEIGWDEYVTCQREGCGYTTYKAIEAKGHDYDLTTGTNNNNGTHTVTCPNCDEGTEGHTDVVDCTYGEGVVTAPTCTKGGYTTHTCTACGYFYTDTETTATGHTFGNWTAIGNDKHERICTVCVDEEGRVETADCTYGEWTETKAPTCTEKGEKAHTCSVCKNTVTAEVEALGHAYGDADCLKPATCTRCGATTGEALGHDFTEFVKTVDYTCTEKGYDIYKCSRCDATDKQNYTDAACRPEADYTVTVKATCEANGEKSIFCSVCKKATVTTVIEKREHVYKDNGVKTAATCVAEGVMNTICTNEETAEYAACTHASTRVIPVEKDAHKWETEYTVDKKASCDAAGSKSYHCEYCDDINTESVVDIAKREHNLVDTTEAKAATCTEDGVMNQKCNHTGSDEYEACTYTTTRVIKANGHTLTQVAAQAPTCEGIGWEAYEKCSVCDYTTYEEIAATGHSWSVTYTWTDDNASCTATRVCANDATHNLTETVTAASAVKTPATCEGMGTTTYTATFTADWTEEQSKDVVDIAALGHDYVGVETKAPTCTEKGVMTYTCKNDASHTYTEDIAALNHIDADNNGYCDRETCKELICDHVGQDTVLKDAKEATCTEEGYTGDKHCAKCDVIVEYGEKIDKLGHKWSETFTSNGNGKDNTHYQTCTRENCGVKNEAVAHDWNDGVVTTDPTCEGEGVKTFTCTAKECGATYTEAVDANGHSYGEWIAEVPATCVKEGVKGHYECSVCHKSFDAEKAELTDLTIAIDGSNHVTTTDHDQTDATCLTVGYTAGTFCEDCDKWISGHEEIPAVAHKNKVHHERVESTCSKTGTIEYWSCPDCSKNFSDEACTTEATNLTVAINPDAHKWDEGKVTTEPGCHQMGIKTYTCEYDASHTKTEKIGLDANNHINTENHDAVKETCTSVGYTAGVYCTDCKAYISGHEEIPAIAHKNKVHHEKVDATCVAEGTIEYWSCPDCGKNFSDEECNTAVENLTIEINPDNHDLKTTEAKAPTCTEIGWDAYVTCQREGCGHTTYAEKAANGHAYDLTTGVTAEDGKHTVTCPNCAEGTEGHTKVVDCTYGAGVVTAPTCTKNGYTTHTCTACGYFYTDTETTATGHTFGKWTAIGNDKHERTCTVCADEEGRVETADCTYGEWTETKAPTCTEKGEKAHTCTVCANTVTAEVEALGHNWADADCTKPSTCKRCGETSGEAIGHDFSVFVETVDYTCTTDGYTTYKCVRCEETENRDITKAACRPAADFAVIEKASCEKTGYKAILCTACSKELETQTIAKREHHLVDTTVALAPTCSATGIMNQKCDCAETAEYEACDYTTTRVMDKVADAHKAEADYTVMQKATCEADGYKAILCEYCDAELKTETIAKREHVYVDNGVKTAATCKAEGVMNTICSNVETDTHAACTHESTRVIPVDPNAHKAEADYTVMQKATCEADGYKAILCEYCDAELSKETIAKREHVYVDNGVKTAATCKAEGVMNTICSNVETDTHAACTHESTRVIPVDPNAHKAEVDYTVMQKATCEADGYKAILCEYCDAELSKETIAKREHVYVDNGVKTAATCVAEGVMNTICSNVETDTHKACAHESTRVIPATGHTFGLTTPYVAATCTTAGNEAYKVCNNCNLFFAETAENNSEDGKEDVTSFVIPAKGHDYGTWIAEVPATCIKEGVKGHYECSVCHKNFDAEKAELTDLTIAVNSNNHVNTTGHAQTDATCLAVGYTAGTFCEDCKTWISGHEEIPAIAHKNKVHHEKVDATCVATGTIEYWSCPDCSKNFSDEACNTVVTDLTIAIDPNNHDLKTTAAKAPTCTEIGWDAYVTCSRCDYTTYVEKAALGHDEIAHEAKAPTCTEIGWDAYVTCSRCDYTTYAEKAALGHDEIAHEAKAPTCTEIGWDAYVTCSRCDYTTYVEKAKLGHDEIAHEAKAPTCTEIGWDAYVTCSRCDYTTYVEKAALGHDEIDHEAKAPTCTEIGWDAYVTCSRCDYTTYAEKAALGHTVVVDKAVAPTCTETGLTEGSHCDVCGEVLVAQTVVDALGHKYKAVVTAPTCTAEGFTTYTCSVCDDSYVADKVAALGHTEGEVVVENEVAATCTKEGSYENVVYCTVCDAELSRETVTVDKIAHTAAEAAKENEIAATCEENGSYDMVVRCAVCKEILSSESFTTDAIGHDYKLDNLVRPTKQADGTWGNGYETYVCQNDPKHIETKLVERADYTEYDKIVEELEERLDDETLSDEVRAEIEDLLENNKVEPDRIASEQDAVSDAAESIVSGSTSYLKTYKVTFVADGNVISEQTVFYGAAAIAPEAPQKEGFIFTGWSGAYTNVKADTTVTATYYEGDIILTLSASDLSVAVGKTAQLTATVLPAEKNDLELTWSVADSAIAKVDANGVVTGLKNGITTVTVSAFDGNISATATVYVYNTNGDYTVQLAKSPFGNFVVGDYTFYETAYINVRPGQEFRFRFALSGGYTADDVIITVNGMEISVDSENYFTIPYATDNLTILAVPAPGSGLGGNGSGSDSDSDSGSNSMAHSCWCHSRNKLLQFLWKILMFFCRIFGIEKYHYCGCGKAHW